MEKLYILRDNFPIATIESHDRQTWHFTFTRQGIEAGIEISNSFSINDEIDQSCVKNWGSSGESVGYLISGFDSIVP